MKIKLSPSEFVLLQTYIRDLSEIVIPQDKSYFMESRLSKLLADMKIESFEEFYHRCRKEKDSHLKDKLIEAMTTRETFWFRDILPWKILEEVFLPRFCKELLQSPRKKVRIWSAAVASGQEAYSTSICIYEYLERQGLLFLFPSFEILGTDISKTALQIARDGSYDELSITRGLEPVLREKYFQNDGDTWKLDPKLMEIVTLEYYNIKHSIEHLGPFDIIFLRYVMIYFSDEFRHTLLKKISKVLHSDGTLFIGASEVFSKMDQYFERQMHSNGYYYKRL